MQGRNFKFIVFKRALRRVTPAMQGRNPDYSIYADDPLRVTPAMQGRNLVLFQSMWSP